MATTNPALKSGSKYADLKRRLWFLLGALIVYRIGTHIPVPGINASVLDELFKSQQGGILGLFNVFSGGALQRFSILALGIMPYISASIIMQLCTVVVPSLEALKKEGEAGRRKITQYTRYATLGLAFFQALGISIALEAQQGLVMAPGLGFRVVTAISSIRMMKTVDSAPVRPSSRSAASAVGRLATMPAKMISEVPLPTPRAVICSPSHIRNIVPVTRVIADTIWNATPGLTTRPGCASSAIEMPKAWNNARPSVP